MHLIVTQWVRPTQGTTVMGSVMKSYTIIMTNDNEPLLTYNKVVEKLTFPEAVAAAYLLKNNMGHDWRITNVREDIKRPGSSNCASPGTISIT